MSNYTHITSGEKYLEKHPNFKLVGRDQEINQLFGILMRKKSNNVLISGPGGSGASAICMGMQQAKEKPVTPLDITNKRLFWLDTDSLFSSSDAGTINADYAKLSATLRRTPEAVLIIDDFKDFIDAARSNGCTNLINSLMSDIKSRKFQAILETRDADLDPVIKCHSDMQEFFTLLDITEPSEENLQIILQNVAPILQDHHGIKISQAAIDAAIELTLKYRANDASLSRAQPERSITLLDRALTKYRQDVHSRPEGVDDLQAQLDAVNLALAGEDVAHLKGKKEAELEILQAALQSDIHEKTEEWETNRQKIEKFRKEQIKGEELIRQAEDEIAVIVQEEEERKKNLDDAAPEDQAPAKSVNDFMSVAKAGGFESQAVVELRKKIQTYEKIVQDNKTQYDTLLAKINSEFELDKEHVYQKFSALSGIPVNKLNQDERQKLLKLDELLSARVFDQSHVIQPLSNAVRAGRTGLRDRNKPQGAFIFLGPSGVGKTELAKALTQIIYDDERALLRLDMSDYQEKHAVAKLIGAPPGYEGFEVGGILTNAMRVNPRRIILLDEVEKAHPDVFDVLLQVVDDARLSDNVGRVVSFSDAVVILTSNIGSEYFLDPNLSYEEAHDLAMEALNKKFRPEFLNRFNGRRNIKCFNRLSLDAIEKIITRELGKWNEKIASHGLSLEMDPADIKLMCAQEYDPVSGARGPKGYLESYMEGNLSMVILGSPDAKGVMKVTYDPATRDLTIHPPKANDNILAFKTEAEAENNKLTMEA